PKTGKDFTRSMNKFTKKFISELKEIDGFILKYKSPSCGKNNVNIYYYNEDRKPLSGKGFFGGSIQETFSHLAIEDEGRLNNFTIRENWLTQLFVLAEFRVIEKNINALVKFHSRNKLLFMAYSQVRLKEMGRVVANNGSLPVKEVFSNYYNLLCDLLNGNPNFHKWINALMHAFGGINSELTSEEKVFFLDKLEEYRDERIPKSVLKGILESWAIRFNNEYLLSQSILNPYPKELNEITDSGKGRNY
ncbi:MAG: DUF1722 domain-containing protein, partial [Candidatus Dadabacteria bacterium]|nr:DUF1722 domain-containing protein [Candidatus Dadabacteria bacterium]